MIGAVVARTQRRWRRIVAAAGAGVLVPAMASTPAFAENLSGTSDTEAAIAAKVQSEVLDDIESDDEAEFWLMLDDQPDFSAAQTASTKEEKGTAAVNAAKAHASETQAGVLETLEAEDVDHREFWIVNTVRVNGDYDMLAEMALLDEVNEIISAPEVEHIEPVEESADYAPSDDVTWGLDDINAPDVWDDFGVDGEGVVVASIDTGVQVDHPALVDSYRGNDGDGNFDHDYNFMDVESQCDGEEYCDTNGHGTHVHGTMTGGTDDDDVAFGVAPGAEWIAVNGCCPSNEALLEAGEWIAAPTDQNGENPDPTMAPHAVNNSWGTTVPTHDPFYKGIVDSWWEMGIFPGFAAGNSGPGCDTAGSPGGYVEAFSVGSHTEGGDISSFSSRGGSLDPDGDIKPELSAPGTDVYSAWPGDGYNTISGTSMAAPHMVGTVALMISAAPALEGDIDEIWSILNETTASDEFTGDTSCGGDEEFNNVFGHGKLDAHAAVLASPMGDTGSLEGTVSEVDGDALEGATVSAEGEFDYSGTTDSSGEFAFPTMPVGEYDIMVSLFGYGDVEGSVEIAEDETTTFDAELETVPGSEFSSMVVDPGEHAWPLDATVSVIGEDVSTSTDPFTGEFSITLPEGEHDLLVEANYSGYESKEVNVVSSSSDVIELAHVDEGCLAPGYGAEILGENFESDATPAGWSVEDNGDLPWFFDSDRANETPGEGGFAIADSDIAGSTALVDTELISPVFDLSIADTPELTFDQDYRHLGGGYGAVYFSADAGDTWEEVWYADANLRDTSETVDLSEWADATEAQVKFHFNDEDSWSYWWMLDNVGIGPDSCEAIDGGILRGEVTDSNGDGVADAEVSAGTSTTTTDSNGNYWVFTGETGDVEVEASHPDYSHTSSTVTVDNSEVVGADFELGTTEFVTNVDELESFVQQGAFWTHHLEISNEGNVGGEVSLDLAEGDFEMQGVSELADTDWVSVSEDEVYVDAGETVTVEVTTSSDADVDSTVPGLYSTTLELSGASPHELPVVDVSMRVSPGADEGKIVGNIQATDCDGDVADLSGAQVQFTSSSGQRFDLTTDADGFYEHWVSTGAYTIIVSSDGYAAEFTQVDVDAGTTNFNNFTLEELDCAA